MTRWIKSSCHWELEYTSVTHMVEGENQLPQAIPLATMSFGVYTYMHINKIFFKWLLSFLAMPVWLETQETGFESHDERECWPTCSLCGKHMFQNWLLGGQNLLGCRRKGAERFDTRVLHCLPVLWLRYSLFLVGKEGKWGPYTGTCDTWDN